MTGVDPGATGRKPRYCGRGRRHSAQPCAPPEISGLTPLGITVSQAVHLSGLSRSLIWILISQGVLKSKLIRRRRIILYQSLRELIEGQNSTAPGEPNVEGSENIECHDVIHNPSGANLSNR